MKKQLLKALSLRDVLVEEDSPCTPLHSSLPHDQGCAGGVLGKKLGWHP